MAQQVSQEIAEVLGVGSSNAEVSQEIAEVLASATSSAQAAQVIGEALVTSSGVTSRVSQLVVEVLVQARPGLGARPILMVLG